MAIDLARLVVTMEANSARFVKEFERVDQRLGRWEKNAKRSFKNVEASFSQFQSAIAALGIGLLFREIVRASDSLTLISGRLRLVTKDTAELAQVQNRLFQVAQNTRASFETTAELYARAALNSKNLGVSQEALLKIVETTNRAIVIGGASAAEAAGGVRQFTQAIASGELRGEELRSVMENMPRLAQAIAEGLETDIGGLRRLSKEGELTAERVVRALLSQQDKIAAEFEKMPRTVGQAVQQLRNQMLILAGSADMSGLVGAIDEIRAILADPAVSQGLVSLAQGLVSTFATAARFISETVRAIQYAAEVAASLGLGEPLNEELTARFNQPHDRDISINIKTTLDGKPGGIAESSKALEKHAKELDRARAEVLLLNDAEGEAAQMRALVNELYAKGKIPQDAYLAFLAEANVRLDEANENAAKAGDGVSVMAEQAARNIQTFTSSLVDAALAGEDMGDTIVAVLRRIAAEMITLTILRSIGEGAAKSDNPTVAAIGQLLLQRRASGGPVESGRPYVVGERGPELFVPRVSGAIVPNDMIGGGSVEVNLTVDNRGAGAADAATFIRGSAALAEQIEARIAEGLARGRYRVAGA